MLQDLEHGRPMEIDPLVTVVQEMGRLTRIPTPALDAVLARLPSARKSPDCMVTTGRPRQKLRFLHDRVA
jgi:ketopantoate reductase